MVKDTTGSVEEAVAHLMSVENVVAAIRATQSPGICSHANIVAFQSFNSAEKYVTTTIAVNNLRYVSIRRR